MTGPEPDYNEIIQIGAVLYDDDWLERGQYLTNVHPENKEAFSSSSEKIHNLSLAELDDAPMIYDVLPELEEWICTQLGLRVPTGQLDRTPFLRDVIICGQSVINDINFLKPGRRSGSLPVREAKVALFPRAARFAYACLFYLSGSESERPQNARPAKSDGHCQSFRFCPRRWFLQRFGRCRADGPVFEGNIQLG